jgi:hypothetical protein
VPKVIRSPSSDDVEESGAGSEEEVAGGVRKGQVDTAAFFRHRLGHIGCNKQREMPWELLSSGPLKLLLDLRDREAPVYVLDLGQKEDLLALQLQFDLGIESRVKEAARSAQELDGSTCLRSEGFHGFMEELSFDLGEMDHLGDSRSGFPRVHGT